MRNANNMEIYSPEMIGRISEMTVKLIEGKFPTIRDILNNDTWSRPWSDEFYDLLMFIRSGMVKEDHNPIDLQYYIAPYKAFSHTESVAIMENPNIFRCVFRFSLLQHVQEIVNALRSSQDATFSRYAWLKEKETYDNWVEKSTLEIEKDYQSEIVKKLKHQTFNTPLDTIIYSTGMLAYVTLWQYLVSRFCKEDPIEVMMNNSHLFIVAVSITALATYPEARPEGFPSKEEISSFYKQYAKIAYPPSLHAAFELMPETVQFSQPKEIKTHTAFPSYFANRGISEKKATGPRIAQAAEEAYKNAATENEKQNVITALNQFNDYATDHHRDATMQKPTKALLNRWR